MNNKIYLQGIVLLMKSEFIDNFFGLCERVHGTGVMRGVLMKASGIFPKNLILKEKKKTIVQLTYCMPIGILL